jgi:potassium-transporting ATPase potassium-binding subunit
VSFVTNTNWQNYLGEQTMSHLTQMTGLAVQNFLSAGVGLAVAVALIRGLTRRRAEPWCASTPRAATSASWASRG